MRSPTRWHSRRSRLAWIQADQRCRVPRADLSGVRRRRGLSDAEPRAYSRRLITPYETAYGGTRVEESPHVFAIPGNHDWYDGLTAFARLFCSEFEADISAAGGRGSNAAISR